ncbi:hypothetical protein SCUCBS95973_000963 [Sporothrix curviconia]|uniref:Glycolipid transfer protein domain-containing protein n=1 Tax=Sporothrix curviconia TaxID=1260050 RepID=A0ABP0AUJ1_9PEZI
MAQKGDFLDHMKRSFADVPIDTANDNAIDTLAFLEASEEVLKLSSAFGSIVNGLVGSDIKKNIDGVREGCQRNPLHAATLQSLCAVDAKAQEKLMWLLRGLRFIYYALTLDVDDKANDSVPEDQQTLSKPFAESYDKVLSEHHFRITRMAISKAISASLPTAKDFYGTLSSSRSMTETRQALKPWLEGLGHIVDIMYPLIDTSSPEFKARAKAKK